MLVIATAAYAEVGAAAVTDLPKRGSPSPDHAVENWAELPRAFGGCGDLHGPEWTGLYLYFDLEPADGP